MSSSVFHHFAIIPEFLTKYYQDWQRKSILLEHIHFLNDSVTQDCKEISYKQTQQKVVPGLPCAMKSADVV